MRRVAARIAFSVRQLLDLNQRGHSPIDFKSIPLTARASCLRLNEIKRQRICAYFLQSTALVVYKEIGDFRKIPPG